MNVIYLPAFSVITNAKLLVTFNNKIIVAKVVINLLIVAIWTKIIIGRLFGNL